MKSKIISTIGTIFLLIIFIVSPFMVMREKSIIKAENVALKQELQVVQEEYQKLKQQKAGFTEGKYTLITNLSSSIYLNRIPNNFDKIYPWEDVNGVKGFDTVSGGLYLRYVEGHIEWPQLALYAPNMHLEVVSESKWPKGE